MLWVEQNRSKQRPQLGVPGQRASGLRRLVSLLLLLLLIAEPALANYCAQPGKDGTGSPLSGVVNTYFPGQSDETAGNGTITLGAATGASVGISAGDLLLIMQMQDATIDSGNDDAYGSGNGGGFANGYTGLGQSGAYEFVRATNSVPVGGGSLTIVGASGGGLINAYTEEPYSTGRRRAYQVVRVPQYIDATITGALTAVPWNGSSGGIVAIDVAGRLTFAGGSISVAGQGFRGGGGRALGGAGGGSSTSYRSSAANAYHGAKGEGIAGTPRYVNNNGSLLDTGTEGYANGSNARGAPANAGGGGSDGDTAGNSENTGGGGGGNAGAGGRGGYAWCSDAPNYDSCSQTGGHPGGTVPNSVSRLIMGGGGGAATNNNSTGSPGGGFASSGAAGGGVVFIRAGEIAGSGSIDADGADANSTVTNDGTGGGGAGGSVMIASLRTVAGGSIAVTARGGDGGTNTGGGSPHGPGGGGGGGYVANTSTIAVSASVGGGSAGTTNNQSTFGVNYGATNGSSGSSGSISGASIIGQSSGGECTPTITKAFATSPVTPGSPSVMSIAITNNNPTTAMTALAFVDSYPSGLVNTATPAPARSCATGSMPTATANGNSFNLSGGSINAAASCTYSVNTRANSAGDKTNTIATSGMSWTYGSGTMSPLAAISATLSIAPPLTIVKTNLVYIDPVNGLTNPKAIPGSYIAYTLTVANPGSYTVDNNSIYISDATPPNMQLFVSNIPGGSGPVLFTNGSPASGLTYTFTSLASTTDDVEFSNNNGSTWTYTPVANALLVDPAVTNIRIRPKGTMAAGSNFTLTFGYMIR